MKNRIVKKILRIILLVLVGAAVIGTFYFLWKKAQPLKKGMWKPRRSLPET